VSIFFRYCHATMLGSPITSSTVNEEDFVRRFQFLSPLPLNGRHLFSMWVDIRRSVAHVKQELHNTELLEAPLSHLALFLEGEELADDRTLDSYPGIRCLRKSTLALRGSHYDLHVVTAGVEHGMPVRWHPHMTLTELVRSVWRRWRIDVTISRFRMRLVVLPTDRCVRNPRLELCGDVSLLDLGFEDHGQKLCGVWFRRAHHGALLNVDLRLPAVATVNDVLLALRHWELQRKMDTLGPLEGLPGGPFDKLPLAPGAMQADYSHDENEDPIFSGHPSVYLFRPDTPGYDAAGLPEGTAYFSLRRPPLTQPEWVDIELDLSIPHLSDLGVRPGSTITLDFFSKRLRQWSGDEPFPRLPAAAPLITVRAPTGRTLHVAVDMGAPVRDILTRIWCLTGEEPHRLQLELEDRRILPEWQSLEDLDLLPETAFLCTLQSANNTQFAPKALHFAEIAESDDRNR